MFKHQGPARSEKHNRLLAGYLAWVAGFVNSAGFITIGSFTSHVTGSVGRLANDVALRDEHAAIGAGFLILAFFAGAFIASVIVESDFFRRTAFAYGVALLAEAGLLFLFVLFVGLRSSESLRAQDTGAALLCVAMGMQNSLVTRLSGAVVRTTHLTGVVTDLGIELARWFRWGRAQLSRRLNVPLVAGRNPAAKPERVKLVLWGTIVGSFLVGAILGAWLSLRAGAPALALPAVAILAAGGYAFLIRGPTPPVDHTRGPTPPV
jgi:uncharacterized membrane protein YoaK (UPF0700 family)